MLISSHYRSPINYSAEIIEQCRASLDRLYNCRENLVFALDKAQKVQKDGDDVQITALGVYRDSFIEAMDDDLNTADAIAAVFALAREINTNLTGANTPSEKVCTFALSLFDELTGVLGLVQSRRVQTLDQEIEALIAKRAQARKNKDWATADKIRDELKARHIVLEDTPQGVKWRVEE